jgi:predicted metalloenzyme YecM
MESDKLLSSIIGDIDSFINTVIHRLDQSGVSPQLLEQFEIDHVCYRCSSFTEYRDMKNKLGETQSVRMVDESMVGGRPISIFELKGAIKYNNNNTVKCLELASPKIDSYYPSGLEHLEIVVGNNVMDMIDSYSLLQNFVSKFPEINFDFKSARKEINGDVKLNLGEYSVKFHGQSLLNVCQYEKEHGLITPVPDDFIEKQISRESSFQ